MLTEEGQEAARECLLRSRLLDPREGSANVEVSSDVDMDNASDLESAHPGSTSLVISSSVGLSRKKKSIDVPLESLERVLDSTKPLSQEFGIGYVDSLSPF